MWNKRVILFPLNERCDRSLLESKAKDHVSIMISDYRFLCTTTANTAVRNLAEFFASSIRGFVDG